MLAYFLASTPLLRESWRLCDIANTTAVGSFVTEQLGDVGYIAFSGTRKAGSSEPPIPSDLVSLESTDKLFFPLHRHNEGEEPVMVHAGMLNLFLSIHASSSFKDQVS